jgi:glycosyltransferase involved in cell wall biosynthesis
MLFVPMYNCAPQIGRALAQVTPDLAAHLAEVFVLDNGSSDGGVDAALRAGRAIRGVPVVVARNRRNQGLGGSHKLAFERCLQQGYDGVVVFHGDDQGRLVDLMPSLGALADVDCVLGARFARGSRLQGYSLHRIAANIAFNVLFSALFGRWLSDLGSGLNAYRRAFLERVSWRRCADDLTFNYHLLFRTLAEGASTMFVPISWREEDQVSNAKLVRHGVQMLRLCFAMAFGRRAWLRADHASELDPRAYEVLS